MSSHTLILSSTCGIALLLGTSSALEAMNPQVQEYQRPSAPLQRPEGTVPAPLTQEDLVEDPEGEEPRDLSDVQRMLAFSKLIQTESPPDMALVGGGYFMLRGLNGSIFFTRNGRSSVNENGILVNNNGLPFLDENENEISVKNGIKIDLDGTIRDRDENVITRLGIVEFDAGTDFVPVGNCLFRTDTKPSPAKETEVHQGYLEPSKVELKVEVQDLS